MPHFIVKLIYGGTLRRNYKNGADSQSSRWEEAETQPPLHVFVERRFRQ